MITEDKLRFQAANLSAIGGIDHGFFTRLGGVSDGLYESLNCGVGSRDVPEAVSENRARVARLLGTEPGKLATVYQKHSNIAVVADETWARETRPEADAVVTATPGLVVGIVTADCAPVLLCDPEARVVGAAHAGWRGAFTGIVEATVAAMTGLGAKPDRVVAAIGPAISQGAYEVGADYKARFLATEPDAERFFANDDGTGEPHFDLPAYVADRLARAEVGEIYDLGLCTYYDETRLYSYRRSQHHGEADYGRQISAIVLT
ncbi:polyphenol oxidase [Methyloceanibacter methanicus]|uniref:Purine nucleoside phosphorylase n=1 Tax=Methyloceanibacter methanicus TaxID=1774968 RepID=A0A1E3W3U8_9HYPH|nr:peptidoglycan editing factor PgeF [Methyloceanibacter methanicus]ODS00182.1 polyphenol oxidase [Methyloceanibacter methanicus]